ncbi:MAG: NAD-glutamate dehydrogenase [Alphaproteobacteria bacterium]
MTRTAISVKAEKKQTKKAHKNSAAPKDFIAQLFAQLGAQDLASLPPELRAVIGTNYWHFMAQRKPRQTLIRVFNPDLETDGWKSSCTVVELVQDDMPFLIDSAMGAINQLGFAVQHMIHPVLRIARDDSGRLLRLLPTEKTSTDAVMESCIHIQCDEIRDPQQRRQLEQNLHRVFHDVRDAVKDWKKMLHCATQVIAECGSIKGTQPSAEEIEETRHFLHWLCNNNFTFLGYRCLKLATRNGRLELPIVPGSGLGVLKNPDTFVFNNLRDLAAQPPEVQRFMQERRLLLVTKTNTSATVHRVVPMDAIFIKRFDANGQIIGEHLFVGLFTSFSYSRSPREIPVLRQKVNHVMTKAGFDPVSHDGKALIHILDNYPRDEMFQISGRALHDHAIGILRLQERQRLALFTRRDPFERMVTCLIYVPRDQYDSSLRNKFQQILAAAFAGSIKNVNVRIDDNPLARIFITVATTPGATPKIDQLALEEELRDVARAWSDRLRDRLHTVFGDQSGRLLTERYNTAFPLDYRETVSAELALQDIGSIETMAGNNLGINLLHLREDPDEVMHLRIFHRGVALDLSQVLPIIENMGLYVQIHRGPYVITPQGATEQIWLHDFIGKCQHQLPHALHDAKDLFEETLHRVWEKAIPDDGFNQLALRAALPWRKVNILRTLAKYALQIRSPHSLPAVVAALAKHARLTQLIVALFIARHDPATQDKKGTARTKTLTQEAMKLLGAIPNLDEDRIMRRFLNLVQASLRTNYFQTAADGKPKDYLAIKFNCAAIENLPLPRPLYEVFVASPRVEAIHLRGGKVARGGIRWSDRPEDFRTEILSLMKAQMVKNSVIVPVGAKGGFIVKHPNPQEPVKEGIACYKILMRGLLDLTDNRINGKIVPPPNVVRHDGDDPYLVVAADKGTAKFSDIANSISLDYGFWLGDAFASGGSVGYDHKRMGITARGAWEAVKRHFREMAKDVQRERFTCIGVGDMSGDVFGNGMLRSKHTLLCGAFDHRHIFCDPTPDPSKSYSERNRMFKLPTSSWADYNPKLISKGGGIFSRALKTIPITPEMRTAYNITAESLSPNELIQAMLRAPVDLLYFGGIGTYVKATEERPEEAGDRTNDALRIDGCEIRAKVVSEGANLAMTQRGRIEYALKGGRLNTDAIDNSAGVDTSDHEVNIKIALSKAITAGKMSLPARNKMLTAMTDDVAALVLRDNYLQTQALSVTEAQAPELLGVHGRAMRMLERSGLLNRRVEFLPVEDELTERQRLGRGLTRPEMAVLLAYAKIWLFQQLTASRLPDDPFLQTDLMHYFPRLMQAKCAPLIAQHQLRREIIATSVTNSLINHAGIHFVLRMTERTGFSAAAITRAYLLAREIFEFDTLWERIEALDNKIPATAQIAMQVTINQVLERVVPWLLRQHADQTSLDQLITHYRRGVAELTPWLERNGETLLGQKKQQDLLTLQTVGTPADLARHVVMLPLLATAPDLQNLGKTGRSGVATTADIYFRLDHQFGFTWLRERIQQLPAQTPWQRDASLALQEEMFAAQRKLAAAVLRTKGGSTRYQRWSKKLGTQLTATEQMLQELRAASKPDLAMLTLMTKQLDALA